MVVICFFIKAIAENDLFACTLLPKIQILTKLNFLTMKKMHACRVEVTNKADENRGWPSN